MSLYWIDHPAGHRLAIMARPRAGDWLEDEIARWRGAGVGIVVSLLEAEEIEDLGLGDEGAICREDGIAFRSFPIPDRGVPSDRDDTDLLIREIVARCEAGDGVAIHCRAGIGRSSLIAALVLRSAGLEADQAFALISEARGLRVPDTDGQVEWVGTARP